MAMNRAPAVGFEASELRTVSARSDLDIDLTDLAIPCRRRVFRRTSRPLPFFELHTQGSSSDEAVTVTRKIPSRPW